jgi:hypothetical protein
MIVIQLVCDTCKEPFTIVPSGFSARTTGRIRYFIDISEDWKVNTDDNIHTCPMCIHPSKDTSLDDLFGE